MLMLLVLFAVIFFLVLAYAANENEMRVMRIGPVPQRKIAEIRETAEASAARTAARKVLYAVIGAIVLFIVLMTLCDLRLLKAAVRTKPALFSNGLVLSG